MIDLAANLFTTLASSGGSFYLPPQASTVADSSDSVFYFITYLCYFFFVLIVGLMIYFTVKYKKPRGTPAEGGSTHNTAIEVTWTVIPLILVVAIFYVGLKGYMDIRTPPAETYDITVTAKKWQWEFEHLNGCIEAGQGAVLYAPLNTPVLLTMTSDDVLHSLFIPAFRVKQDVVPGRITTLWFEATEPGVYDLFCAEYCGKEHSKMVAQVEVLPEAEFQAKVERCAQIDELYTDERLHELGAIYWRRRCASCHTLRDAMPALTGPSWEHLWEKAGTGETVFTDGSVLADLYANGTYAGPEDYISQSIVNPQKHLVENYKNAMPTFQGSLRSRGILGIIAFMNNLDLFDENGNLLEPAAPLPAGGN